MSRVAKPKNYNTIEINGKIYEVVGRAREKSEVLSTPYSIAMYVEAVERGKISRDALIQRTDDQWTTKQSGKCIESILHNRPIGTFVIASGRSDTKNYLVSSLVDGLQRTTCIVRYRNDEFALGKNAAPVRMIFKTTDDEEIEEFYNIAGKKYSQLPDILKEFFDEYRLEVYRYSNFSDEELDNMVYCMNNGKTPTAYQKMRFMLGSENMSYLQPICNSPLWEDVAGCKAKNDSILCTVIRTLMILTHYSFKNLGSAAMNKFIDEDVFSEYVKLGTIKEISYLVDQLEQIKYEMTDDELEFLNACNIPHLLVNLKKFNSMPNPDGKTYLEFLRDFWNSDMYEVYQGYCESGSGSSLYSDDNVSDRQCCLDDLLDDFLDCPIVEDNIPVMETTDDVLENHIIDIDNADNDTNTVSTQLYSDAEIEIEGADRDESGESRADKAITSGNGASEERFENTANDNRPLQTDDGFGEYGNENTSEERIASDYIQTAESEFVSA